MSKDTDNEFERIVQKVVTDIEETIDRLPEFAPLGAKKLSTPEQIQRYLEIENDPQKWLELIKQRGLRQTVEYALSMEREVKRMIENG